MKTEKAKSNFHNFGRCSYTIKYDWMGFWVYFIVIHVFCANFSHCRLSRSVNLWFANNIWKIWILRRFFSSKMRRILIKMLCSTGKKLMKRELFERELLGLLVFPTVLNLRNLFNLPQSRFSKKSNKHANLWVSRTDIGFQKFHKASVQNNNDAFGFSKWNNPIKSSYSVLE